MKRSITITAITLLVACLIGWVAYACAKSNRSRKPASEPALDVAIPPISPADQAPQSSTTPSVPAPEPLAPSLPKLEPVLPDGPASNKDSANPPLPLTKTPEPTPTKSRPVPTPATTMNGPAMFPTTSKPASVERPAEPSLTDDGSCCRQDPSVSLSWVGPKMAKVSQPGSYTLMVRNTCSIPVQQVLVRVRIPSGISCEETEPKATTEGSVLAWELGSLAPKQEKALQLKLLAEVKGDVAPQAWVTFTGSSVLHIKVREPKLVLKAQGPEKVLVGETATFTLVVSNPGDGSADQVKIHASLSEGLECPRGSKIDFDIGNLSAGETRNVTVMCVGKIGGSQKCEAVAEADCGLRAHDTAPLSVTLPRLDLQMSGPTLRYLGRRALYSFKVSNPGDAVATNVRVSDLVPEGFKVLAASDGGRHDMQARTVAWFVGELKPGEAREIKLEVEPITVGEFKHKASTIGARGLCAESEWTTRIDGVSALLLEMVDSEDPIEVNSETSYDVHVKNTGSKVETDIKLLATIPDKMEFRSVTGPVRFHEEGKTIVFEPIEKLAPDAQATFRIHVKALEAGTVNFKIQMTSTNLTEPVIKMEATRIYSDAPEVKTVGGTKQ